MHLPIKALFPQHGKFAPETKAEPGDEAQTDKTKRGHPVRHGRAKGRSADASRRAVLAAEPGDEVFVMPFDRACKLIRIDADKGQVVVDSGAFELQVAISDIRLLKDNRRKK